MNDKLFLKIASQVYKYLVDAGGQDLTDEEKQNDISNITFQTIKQDILNSNDDKASEQIIKLYNASKEKLKQIVNKKDKFGYNLLTLAVSNNLPKTVDQLIISGSPTYEKITINNRKLLNIIKNYEIQHNEFLSDEQIEQLKKANSLEITAIDIANAKGYTNIANKLK